MKQILFLSLFFLLSPLYIDKPVFAQGAEVGNTPYGLTPIRESIAYKKYIKRKPSEKSKLMYLIDRFAPTQMQIEYDRYFFATKFAAPFARVFLMQQYQGQSASEWVFQWCDRTFPKGNPIYVMLEDGSRVMGREILLAELALLEKTYRKDIKN